MSQAVAYIKMGLIPVLVIVLYFLVRGDSTPKAENATQPSTPTVSSSRVRTVGSNATNQQPNAGGAANTTIAIPVRTQWPEIRFEQIADVDPFDRRMIFPVMEAAPVAHEDSDPVGQALVNAAGTAAGTATRSTEAIKVQIVFQTSAGIGAMVGDRLIRIGDTLDDGRHVVDITPDNLVLSSASVH